MPSDQPPSPNNTPPSNKPRRRPAPGLGSNWFLWFVVAIFLLGWFMFNGQGAGGTIDWGEFWTLLDKHKLKKVTVIGNERITGEISDLEGLPEAVKTSIAGKLKKNTQFAVDRIRIEDLELAKRLQQEVTDHGIQLKQESDHFTWLLQPLVVVVLPAVVLLALFLFLLPRFRDPLGGGFLSNYIKSPARRYERSKMRVTFDDVAGMLNAKSELQEVVEFLRSPEKFQRLGAVVPKGVLLVGPPGTGKTLLARAVAGEAGVPFYSISGSEFIQMFVGVGASRVRDMFKTAKDNAPAILFIDEIDAVGRMRGAGVGGGSDEREQTLNQILSEMDGFTPTETVIVMAATNRPDVLDSALLRPGRFDRHVTIDRPTWQGRLAILKVHSRDVPLAPDVDLDRLARGTVGLTGADIRNLVNEAALWATRCGKDKVANDDFEYARDKILMGAKREEVLTGKDKTMTAYHEAGHALLAWMLPGVERLHKVTIIPRGRSLGVTQLLPEEDRLNVSESELKSRLIFMLGG